MATSLPRLPLALTSASALMSTIAISGGIYGLTNPLAFSESLGIPVTSADSPALPFVSFVAARNLGSGITLFTLLYTGQRKVVGTMMMCGVAVAMIDAWICTKFRATEGKAAAHAMMGIVAGMLGWGMYHYGA